MEGNGNYDGVEKQRQIFHYTLLAVAGKGRQRGLQPHVLLRELAAAVSLAIRANAS